MILNTMENTSIQTEKEAHSIEVKSLSVSYGSNRALNNININFGLQKITTIIGPSGCGKSSLLYALNRISDTIPACRVEGDILIHKKSIFNEQTDLSSLRKNVGLIFQKPNPFPFSIKKNLSIALKEHGTTDKHEQDQNIELVLKQVGLWDDIKDRLDQPALDLSGGQQQRLCFARALVLNPDILLLDEPCSSLDPISSHKIEDLILQLKEQHTIVLVTHQLKQAQRLSDHVALFWNEKQGGECIELNTKEAFFQNPCHPLTKYYLHSEA